MVDQPPGPDVEVARRDVGSAGDRLGPARAPRPPLLWWLPAAGFVGLAAALTVVVLVLVRPPGPLDDPHPARQRDAVLVTGPQLAPQIAGVALGGRVVVVLFERVAPRGPAYDLWRAVVTGAGADLIVRVGAAGAALAEVVRIARSADGGPPVGYAVIDAERRVRYATLDPRYTTNAFEVQVILGALP